MKRYPLDRFPTTKLRPDVEAKHEEHLEALRTDIEKYSKIGYRDSSMFDWVLRVFENLGLSTIKKQYLGSLAITKTRLAIFGVQIDDPVDNGSKRNFILFEELLKIPFSPQYIDTSKLSTDEIKYLDFTKELWLEIINEIKKYPKYEKYKEAFDFDLKQLLNGLEYSRFVNTYPNGANTVENDAYVHHGMFVLIQTDLDLMCSEKFDDRELGMLRELSYISQKMAKIGNLIGTYPRELLESDMSSEALVKFQKDFGIDFKFKLNKLLNRENRYPKFEEKLIQEWQADYEIAKEVAKQMKSINGEEFLKEREFIQRAYQIKSDYW